jgi:AbrB family looped-hinge helix DNA binding protein
MVIKITEFVGKKGRYFFGSVKVGERGQIVLPLKARKIFEINAKDDAYIFGNIDKGLGLTTKLDVSEEKLKESEQYFGTAKVGERGQVVIPQKARELFNISPGDLILVFGHIRKGLGFVKASKLKDFAVKLFQAFGGFEGLQNDNGSDEVEKE